MWFPLQEHGIPQQDRDLVRIECKLRQHEMKALIEEEGKSWVCLEAGIIDFDWSLVDSFSKVMGTEHLQMST